MNYKNTLRAKFIDRPNRFIANVEMADGTKTVCHVKNTGRCRELLVPGCQVVLSVSDNPARKTAYDLICAQKGERLINLDSQAPNAAAAEKLPEIFPDLTYVKPEFRYGASRFDFYCRRGSEEIFAEVKGVTLEKSGAVYFPDAPTERGTKHLRELCRACGEGYRAAVIFIIQMKNVNFFAPNTDTDPIFAKALVDAAAAGVEIYAYDCIVNDDSMTACDPVKIALSGH